MKRWREQWRREEPFISIIFWAPMLAAFIAETTMPLVVIAAAMSFIVPVEPWVVILAVVAGWPSQWALLPAPIGWPVKIGVALAWVIGVFAAVLMFGPAALRIIVPALPIAVWAIDKLEGWQEDREADKAVRDSIARYSSGPKSERDRR